jgi:methionyl-tRNA formyltransferase
MLPEAVWNMPPLGSVNLHGSLLPKYRGAAPINRAIMNGETETGVTIFFLQHEIDTGRVIVRERMPIGPDTTAGELHDEMMHLGARVLVDAVNAIADERADAVEQDQLMPANADVPSAPKIFKDDCKVDWSWSVTKVHNHVRGLSPYPAAWSELDGKNVKLFRGYPLLGSSSQPLLKPMAKRIYGSVARMVPTTYRPCSLKVKNAWRWTSFCAAGGLPLFPDCITALYLAHIVTTY